MNYIILALGISFLILIHEFGHFIAAKWFGRFVEEFGIGFPPRLFGKKIGETVYSVNALPFGGFVKIHGEKPEANEDPALSKRSFSNLSVGRRFAIIAAGIVMNFLVGWIITSSVFMVGIPEAVVVTGVSQGSPAEKAGLLQGDVILDFKTSSEFVSFVQSQKGKAVTIHIRHGSEEKMLSATPRLNPPPGEGALGIALGDAGKPRMPFFESLGLGFTTSLIVLKEIFLSLATLVKGLFSGGANLDGFVGPVGIFKVANDTGQFGFVYLLELIGLISLNLVVLNVLPIPALDGGRLLFLIIEKIKGSPLSPRREMIANAIGFSLLIILMVVITVRDVIKIF